MDKRVSALRISNQRAVIDRRQLAASVAEAVDDRALMRDPEGVHARFHTRNAPPCNRP